MRISDWSSDVCSSDLYMHSRHPRILVQRGRRCASRKPLFAGTDLVGVGLHVSTQYLIDSGLVAPPGLPEIRENIGIKPQRDLPLVLGRWHAGSCPLGIGGAWRKDRKSTRLNSSH